MSPPHYDESPQPVWRCCRICHNLVAVETAKTDSDGRAVHQDCYFNEINQKLSSTGRGDGHLKEEKRSWSVIAREFSQEKSGPKFTELIEELIKALDERAALRTNPETKP